MTINTANNGFKQIINVVNYFIGIISYNIEKKIIGVSLI